MSQQQKSESQKLNEQIKSGEVAGAQSLASKAAEVIAIKEPQLFTQLVVAITTGMLASGYNVSKLSGENVGQAAARDIVRAAKNLQKAIEELR